MTQMARMDAFKRAEDRGVDLFAVNPRPLRTRKRLEANDPSLTVRNAWDKTFRSLQVNISQVRKVSPKHS